jgi:hypothetical protein
MSSNPNPNANKPFLTSGLSYVLNTQTVFPAVTAFTGIVAAGSNVLSVSGGANLYLGANVVLDASVPSPLVAGTLVGTVIAFGSNINSPDTSSTTSFILDQKISAGYPTGVAMKVAALTATPQEKLNIFLNNPSATDARTTYGMIIGPLVKNVNDWNTTNPSTGVSTGKNGLRVLVTADDGLPIIDTGKCVFNAAASNQIYSLVGSSSPNLGNTYANFANKLTYWNDNFNDTNKQLSTVGTTNEVNIIGTAGGNGVNENHHTRPEMLLALFSNTSTGSASRWSSSTKTVNLYLAQRLGFGPESNFGCVRVNVPTIYA